MRAALPNRNGETEWEVEDMVFVRPHFRKLPYKAKTKTLAHPPLVSKFCSLDRIQN
jgi:hypothetical protein